MLRQKGVLLLYAQIQFILTLTMIFRSKNHDPISKKLNPKKKYQGTVSV
jgi:hypothetical protein